MTKRLSIIACIVSVAAVVAGFFFTDADKFFYKWLNGPPLMTEDFFQRIETANNNDSEFKQQFGLSASGNEVRFDYPTKGEYVEVGKLKKVGKTYTMNIIAIKLSDDTNAMNYCQTERKYGPIPPKAMNLKSANRFIDKWRFPNPLTRRAEKQKMLKRIYELNSLDNSNQRNRSKAIDMR